MKKCIVREIKLIYVRWLLIEDWQYRAITRHWTSWSLIYSSGLTVPDQCLCTADTCIKPSLTPGCSHKLSGSLEDKLLSPQAAAPLLSFYLWHHVNS